MKKVLLVAFLLMFAISSFTMAKGDDSKFYFDAGLKGGYGLTMFMNNNIFSNKYVVTEFSFGPSFGARLGGNFNENNSINFEFLYSGFNQKYTVTDQKDSLRWNKTISYSTFDFAFLYRHFVNGSYVEIGPEMASIHSATETNSITGKSDVSKDFVPNYYAAIAGFGANFLGNDNVSVMAGIRATYALSDIISDAGGKSTDHSYPLNDQFYKTSNNSYKPTNPLTVRIIVEVSLDLGYFTRSNCNKRRTKFVTF